MAENISLTLKDHVKRCRDGGLTADTTLHIAVQSVRDTYDINDGAVWNLLDRERERWE